MKTLIIFAAIYIIGASALDKAIYDKWVKAVHAIATECSKELNPSPDDIAELISQHYPPSTHEGKCMIFCVYKHYKGMDADGTPNKAAGIAAIEPLKAADAVMYGKLVQIVEKCYDTVTVDADPCETASNFAVCGKSEADAIGLHELIV